MDFREAAVERSLRIVENTSETELSELDASICVPTGSGTGILYAFEMPVTAVSMLCMLNCIGIWPLRMMGYITGLTAAVMLVVGLVLLLLLRKIQRLIMNQVLRNRENSLLPRLQGLKTADIGLEEAETVEKTKLVTEDQGVCILDPDRERILIEGCRYRYVILAKDVHSVDPVSGYALSGAKVTCSVAGEPLAFVLTVAGHGPVASMMQAFLPGAQAGGFVAQLNATLFGTNAPGKRPPPLPVSSAPSVEEVE